MTVTAGGWCQDSSGGRDAFRTKLWSLTFDLFPRSVGGAKPNALVRILEKHVPAGSDATGVRPIRISFATTYPVRRRTTGSIHRKAVAEKSAAAFRFSPSLPRRLRPCRQPFARANARN